MKKMTKKEILEAIADKAKFVNVIKLFLIETNDKRTYYSSEHDIVETRDATFDDFLEWLER